MKKYIIIICCISLMQNTFAQSIQRWVIGSAGNILSAGGYKISQTIGEAVTSQYAGVSGYTLNQGFQQKMPALIVLPVSWIDFQAIRKSEFEVSLTWKLGSEINNKGFYIERKYENENDFSELMYIPSQAENGTSYIQTSYSCKDNKYNNSKALYRIRQVDIDGTIAYSETRLVFGNAMQQTIQLEVWPIPAKEYFNFTMNGTEKDKTILLCDINGKILIKQVVKSNITYQFKDLIPGNYLLFIEDDLKNSKKIIVQ